MMKNKLFVCALLILTMYVAMFLPSMAVARYYNYGYGYTGSPIKYGGWLVGQAYIEVRHQVQEAAWATITVESTDGSLTKVLNTNGRGGYKAYLPPGSYEVTASYSRYTQKYAIEIQEGTPLRLLNIYFDRPDCPEFQDRLAYNGYFPNDRIS
jgi:hypothetical protein